MVVVAKSGGDFTTVTAALNSITDNSSANRYLVWIAPGAYTETVTMKEYVDIEGAGERTTKITFTGSAVRQHRHGERGEQRRSSLPYVENTGGNTYAIAIYNNARPPACSTSPSSLRVGPTNNLGVYNTTSSSPTMTGVRVTASGGASSNYGVYNATSSSPTMMNVTATASGGVAGNYGIYNLNSSSPMMAGVTARASGASNSNYGVSNNLNSSPTMKEMTATASDGTNSHGVHNDSSSPTMTDMTATASGGSTSNYGVQNVNSSPAMTNVTANASGGTNSYGVANANFAAPTHDGRDGYRLRWDQQLWSA